MTAAVRPLDSPAVRSILQTEPPDILYHYTHRAALIKMLDDHSVIASHIRYLNDAREMALAIGLMQEVLNEQKGQGDVHDQVSRDFMAQWLPNLAPQTQVFVFSLSQDGCQSHL